MGRRYEINESLRRETDILMFLTDISMEMVFFDLQRWFISRNYKLEDFRPPTEQIVDEILHSLFSTDLSSTQSGITSKRYVISAISIIFVT
jgi:hypothetical protein